MMQQPPSTNTLHASGGNGNAHGHGTSASAAAAAAAMANASAMANAMNANMVAMGANNRYPANQQQQQQQNQQLAANIQQTGNNSATSSSSSRKKRRTEGGGNLTVEQKRRICEKHRTTPKITQKDLCRWAKLEFNLKKAPTQPTMSNILKHEHLFKDAVGGVLGSERKTIRPTKHAHFDQVLANWVMERQSKGNITGDMIKTKGKDLAKQMGLEGKLGFSNGWLASFKARHGLVKRNGQQPPPSSALHGPSHTAAVAAAAAAAANVNQLTQNHLQMRAAAAVAALNMTDGGGAGGPGGTGGANRLDVDQGMNVLTSGLAGATGPGGVGGPSVEANYMLPPVSVDLTLEQIQDVLREYDPSDLYTVDETGLYFRASPNKLVHGDEAQSSLANEPSLTVLLATNADASDMMEPYIIGSIVPPRNFKTTSSSQLGYHYVVSSKSRMTVFIFQQWLRDFNAKMASAHRNVVLLMDNAPSHVLGCVNLSNVRVIMFSPHLGMKIQPMRGGILATFKGKYRLKHLTLAIDHLEDGMSDIYHVTQLQAMRWIAESWQTTSKEIVVNAWKPLGVTLPFAFDDGGASSGNAAASDDKNVEEELWGLLYCLQLSGIVNTKVLVNSRWETDIHKRLNEDIIDDPQENKDEFKIPDVTMGDVTGASATGATTGGHVMGGGDMEDESGVPTLTPKELLKSFRDVIRYLERGGGSSGAHGSVEGGRDTQLLSVIELLKKKQLSLRFDNASSTTLTI